jgi:flagellar M-ring protein FliF
MELVRAQLTRIQQQLAGLSASQKMLTASLLAIMIMTLVWWGRYAASAEMEPVLDVAFTPEHKSRITTVLAAHGIRYRLSGDRVLVPAERRQEALAHMALERLLPQDMSKGFDEIIKSMSPWDSASKNEKMWNMNLQMYLASVIREMEGVSTASVIIDPNHQRRFNQSIEPSASVMVTLRPGAVADKRLAESIGALVKGAVASLKHDRIMLVINGRKHSLTDPSSSPLGGSSDLLDLRAQYERHFADQVERALSFIGSGVFVTVSARLNTTATQATERQYTSIQGKERSIETETTERQEPTQAQQDAGVVANTSLAVAPPAGNGGSSSSEKNRTEMENFPSIRESTSATPAGDATPVSASVSIPRSWFAATLTARNPGLSTEPKTPTEQEIDELIALELPKIRLKVQHTLGMKDDSAITVDAYPDTIPMMAASMSVPTGGSGVTVALTSHVKEIAIAVLALVSLFMVSSMVRRGAAPVPAPPAPRPATPPQTPRIAPVDELAGIVGNSDTPLPGMELNDEALQTQQMIDQVSTLVKESPDAAAGLVRRWLVRS